MPDSTTTARAPARNDNIAVMLFVFAVLAALLLFFIPAWIIQPFRPQTSGTLSLALAIRQQAPAYSLVAAATAFAMTLVLWRRSSRVKQFLLGLGVCLACAAAVMARVDYFEWMFHPLTAPGFEAAARSKLDPSEMVMSVRLGKEARAYPIYEMAYHHVLNDVVGGVPIAVTY
jgi:hypothetical protein